jgi:hypothetical protein
MGDVWQDILNKEIETYSTGDSVWEITPPSIEEFMYSDEWLNLPKGSVWKGVEEVLIELFRPDPDEPSELKYRYLVFIASPGCGKSELGSIAISYFVTRLLLLRSPGEYLGLRRNSPVQVINSSASGEQAKRVVFTYLKEKLKNIRFIRERGLEPDPEVESELRFPAKRISVTPASSTGKTVIGTNLICVVMDELSEYIRTRDHDYAEEMYEKFHKRTEGRFKSVGRWLYILLSMPRYDDDFAERKFSEMKNNPRALCVRLPHWKSRANVYSGNMVNFEYRDETTGKTESMQIPVELEEYAKKDFSTFLRQWASLPSRVVRPFIADMEKVRKCFDETLVDLLPDRLDKETGKLLPFYPDEAFQLLPDDFVGDPNKEYFVFTDLAKGEICRIGFCMLHKGEPKNIAVRKEFKNVIVSLPTFTVDLICRFVAREGDPVDFNEIRQFIIRLQTERGFNIKTVGTDSWESLDFRRIMSSKGFNTDVVRLEGDPAVYQSFLEVLVDSRVRVCYRKNLEFEMSKLEINKGKVTTVYRKDEVDSLAGAVNLALRDGFVKSVRDKAKPARPTKGMLAPSLSGGGLPGGGGGIDISKIIP